MKFPRYSTAQWLVLAILMGAISMLQARNPAFSGYWQSTFGHLRLTVNGSSVSGSYSDGQVGGTLSGHLSANGKIMNGTWQEGDLQGKVVFKLLDGGNAFAGDWWKQNRAIGGHWIAVRLEKTPLENPSEDDFCGTWDTNFGKMTLSLNEVNISGTFSGKLNSGALDGTLNAQAGEFEGRWRDNKHTGTVKLRLLPGKSGLIGEWWFDDGQYGGAWYGVAAQPIYGVQDGDCQNGSGTYLWSDGRRYRGHWKEGQYHGMGTAYDESGTVFRNGLWANGIFQGVPVSGDCENGSGELKLPTGDVYKGLFVDCGMKGAGKFTYQNGDIYEGEVDDGVANGSGIYTWKEKGERYNGQFRNGVMQGRGTYFFNNGSSYEGRFQKGERHGQGTFSWSSGDVYSGGWQRDAPGGEGIYTYRNGDRYEGYFIDGRKYDRGTYYFADGSSIHANWKDDRIEFLIGQDDSQQLIDLSKFRTASNLPVTAIQSELQTRRAGYFVYKAEEYSVGNEIIITYHVLYTDQQLTDDQIVILLSQNRTPAAAGYKIQHSPAPESRIRQILNRYRFSLNQVRVNTAEGHFRFVAEAPLAANR